MSEDLECIRTDNDWYDSHMQLRAGFLMKYYSASEKLVSSGRIQMAIDLWVASP